VNTCTKNYTVISSTNKYKNEIDTDRTEFVTKEYHWKFFLIFHLIVYVKLLTVVRVYLSFTHTNSKVIENCP
jgi:hypothetical protein